MPASSYVCPFCRAAIAIADVNVAADIALCRACGKTSAFSMLCGMSRLTPDILSNPPPRGIKVEKDFREGVRIVYRRISPLLLFFIPFTAVWSGGSMWGIYIDPWRRGEFEIGESMMGLPFLIGTVVLLCVMAFMLFGKWVITLNKGEGIVFAGVGSLGWTRRFAYHRDSLVSLRLTDLRVNNTPQKGVLVQTDGTDFVFGATMKDSVKQFIAAYILKEAGGSPW
ncbi:MAG TPA: hypothetical protein DCZ95_04775 [Verrucomicrobia bacterium]|nr:hypothetical protein [Verrucomicrobiota bacterium]